MEFDENIDENEKLNELSEKVSHQEDIIKKLNLELEEKNIILSRTKAYLFDLEYQLDNDNKNEEEITGKHNSQISKLQSKDYCIACLKNEIDNKNYEINYLKKHNIIKKILTPLSYIYLLFKSKPRELKINIKLLKALKDSECFDIGYYLNNNDEVKNSIICKYFSPELHYIINGFEEGYKFNKKYYDRKSKQELLNYIYYCKKY